MIQLDRKPL